LEYKIIFNNKTNETTSTTSGTNSNLVFTRNSIAPSVTTPTNIGFYWSLAFSNSSGIFYFNSTSNNQIINPIYFRTCNSTLNIPYLNFTFKDEVTGATIKAANDLTSVNYWLGDGSLYESYSFSNSSVNSNYSFCFSPSFKDVTVDLTFKYSNSSSPQRTFTYDNQLLTNSTTNKILYLLSSSEGQPVTFQVTNPSSQALSGVIVTASRTIGGSLEILSKANTGADGTVRFFLNPNFEHILTFEKNGYTTQTITITPSEDAYTITMGGQTITQNNTFQGITKSIIPKERFLVNDTSYTFGMTVNSDYWDVSEYGFNLRLANGTIIVGDSTISVGTALTKSYNTGSQSIIYIDYYWKSKWKRTSFEL
jgi:hypothetical protein